MFGHGETMGILSRFLLFSVAFMLSMASTFLLESISTTGTVIWLASTNHSAAPISAPLGLLALGGSGGGDERGRLVMLHNMTDEELLLRAVHGSEDQLAGAPRA